MKKRASQLRQLILLAVMPLVALSPTLALANFHACPHKGQAHCLKSQPCAKFFPESGLRVGRLTSNSPWRSIAKRSPEFPEYTQKIFKTKSPLHLGKALKSPLSVAAYSPRNFLVLRI